MTRFYDHASNAVRLIYEKRIHTPPILNTETDFPHATLYAQNWRAIRDEAQALRTDRMPRFHDIMPEQADISANDNRDWRMFILKAYGIEVPENIARMPKLAGILKQCPEVLSATISVLAPHKHIPRHRGPFRGIMRFHLGLQIPKQDEGTPATLMMINDREYRISDGETLLWDDTFPHEVINRSSQPRMALLLDVWRPNQPLDMAILSHAIIGAVRAGMRYRGVSFTG
ncbi:aspartyl/asparaginyl beta-hydroxylase domain-containing protein [Aestuariivirga sp.]|uniref:aspartyl/asparaginyl beta-hydroxylase domain-containing protein n=1 Tax=Aestuariivirga sp. TaxID=2650926 RepID=UPI0039E3A438